MSGQASNADNWDEEGEPQTQPTNSEDASFKSNVRDKADNSPQDRRPRDSDGSRREGGDRRGSYGDRQGAGRPPFNDRRDGYDRPDGNRRGGYDRRPPYDDDSRYSDSRKPSFDDRREDSRYSDRRDDSRYSDRREDSRFSDRRDDSRYSDRREDSRFSDRRDDSRYSDRRDDSRYPDRRDDSRYYDRRDDSNRREDRFSGYGNDGRKRRTYDDDYQRRDDYDRRPKKTREDPTTPNETIGIFNLSYNLTPKDFEDFLDEKLVDFKGKYTQKLVLNRNTGACRGFGFVTFSDINDAIEAKKVIDNGDILGQPYRAAFSVQRGPSGPRDYSNSRVAEGDGSQCPAKEAEFN